MFALNEFDIAEEIFFICYFYPTDLVAKIDTKSTFPNTSMCFFY